MKSMRHFFTTEGRIYRKQDWLISLPCSLVMLSVDLYMKHLFLSNPNDSLNSDVPIFLSLSDSMIKEGPILLLLFTAFALAISLYLIAAAKRWHDRDKSAWWILIIFIPIVGQLWTLIENGFLAGTNGENRFGADPLHPQPVTMPSNL